MKMKKQTFKRLLSALLCLCMVVSMLPASALSVFAVEADPVCDCGTDDTLIHATTCAVYVAPETAVCYCTEKCSDTNVWCDVCGFDYTRCGGTDTAALYEDTTYPYAVVDTAAGTVTIDGTLGGKDTVEESDITALVDAIKGYVDSGITTISVTGSEPALYNFYDVYTPAVSVAIFRLTEDSESSVGSGDPDSPYCGKIDLILQDVTEIVEMEFNNSFALNSITLPKVTKLGAQAFALCNYLQTITFGSVVTEGIENGKQVFNSVGSKVDGGCCGLVLNYEQRNAATEYQPDLVTNMWWNTAWKYIDHAHTGGTATCTALAVCELCNSPYGEKATDNHTGTLSTYAPTADGSQHSATWDCCNKVETADHTAEPTYTVNEDDNTKHDVYYSCCGTFTEVHSGEATCTTQAVCTTCGTPYGNLADHSMGYSANQDDLTITYKCATCDTQTVTFTLVIPAGAVYGSSGLEVPHYQYSDTTYSGEYPVITLNDKELKNFVPNAGTYAVTMTWGGQTVSEEYTIAKATPTVSAVPTVADRTFDLHVTLQNSDLTGGTVLDVNGNTLEGTWSWKEQSIVPTVNNAGYEAVFTPADTNYDAVTATIEVNVARATPSVTAPSAISGLIYSGKAQTLITAGTAIGGELQYKVDNGTWSTELPTAIAAGEHTVYYRVVGYYNYNDVEEQSITVTIARASLADAEVILSQTSFTYDGKEHKPGVTVKLNGKELIEGTDYKVTYRVAGGMTNNQPTSWLDLEDTFTNVGIMYYAVVEGMGNYITETDTTLYANFRIEPKVVTAPTFAELEESYLYQNGAEIKPTFKLMDGSTEIPASEYSVSYSNNTAVGTATITVMDKTGGNYTVSGSATFEIVVHVHDWKYTADGDTITATCKGNIGDCPDAEQSITISAVGKTYDGTPVTATLTGVIDGVTVSANDISYSGNTNAGTHTASITIEGVTAEAKFTINTATPVLTWANQTVTYTGQTAKITAPTVKLIGDELFNGSIDYTYQDSNGTTPAIPGLPTDVGTYTITATIEADGNYGEVTSTMTLTISKAAAPAIVWPTASSMTYGQKLSDSTLTGEDENGTFAWQDGSIVPAVTNNGYVVVYTPKDTDNYDYTGVELTKTISVTVSKAEPNIIWKSGYYNTYGTNMYITADINGVDGEMIPGTAVATVYGANGNALNSVTCTKTDSTGTYFFNWLNRLSDGTYLTPGEYLVKLTYQGSDNYGEKTVELVTYTINKRALTVTANDNTIIYGDKPAANGVEYSGFVDGETEAVLGGKLTYSYNYEQYGDIGTYTITPSGLTSGNYEITFKTGTLTVNAKEITVTANAVSKTYGDADPELTYKVEGLVNGDKLSGALTREVGTDIGTYAITQGTLTAGSNYTINYTGATLTINTKAITEADVTLNGSLTYTGSEQTQEVTVTEGITYEVSGNKETNVGTYELTVKGTGNYTGEVKLSWTIKETVAVVGTAPTAKDLTYTGKDQALVNDGITADGTMVYSLTEDGEYTESIPTGNAAGNYTVWYKVIGDDNHSDTDVKSVEVTIAKAKAAITVDTTTITVTYGETVTLPEATTNLGTVSCDKKSADLVNAGTYTVTYTVEGTDNYDGDSKTLTVIVNQKAVAEPTVSGTYTYTGKEQTVALADFESSYMTVASGNKGTDAGSYEVVITLDGNYKWADGSDGKVQWSISKAKAEISVNTDPITVTYGETVTLPTATTNFGTVTCDKASADLVNAGTYTVTYTVEGTDNYEGDTKTLTVNVGQKAVAEPTVSGTYTYTGNEQTVTLTGFDSTYMTVASGNKATNAGSYEVVITLDGNHKWADGSDGKVHWSIAKAKAEISVDTDAITVTYGETVTLPTASANFGAVVCDKTAADLVNAGTYTVTYSVAGTDNYDGDAKTITVTVLPKAVTVTAKDQTITYGETISDSAITAEGLVDGHSATATLTPSTAKVTTSGTITASAAVITADGTDVTANYAITYVSGKLVVQPDTTKIDSLTAENVTSANTEDIQAVQDMLSDAESIDDGWKAIEDKCQELLEQIEEVEQARKEAGEQAGAYDDGTVKSTDQEELTQLAEEIQRLLDGKNLTPQERTELEAALEQVNGMIDTIENTAEDTKAATDAVDALDQETVTSADQGKLELAIETIDKLLQGDNLTEDERAALEAAKDEAEKLIEVVEKAQAATDTENTGKVENVTPENVTPENKTDLEKAKADLEKALEENGNNYTEDEKKAIADDIQRIEDAIGSLEDVQTVTEAITALPETATPEDEAAAQKIMDAKEAYDELTDHEKSLVDETTKKKLEDLVAAVTAYEIVKGNGSSWTQGSNDAISFTANGAYNKFAGIKVDGVAVDEANYEAMSGSTIITLKASYLDTLAAGEHTISVVYTDGSADGTFKIVAKPTTPATGDEFNIAVYGALAAVSAVGLFLLILDTKKRMAR